MKIVLLMKSRFSYNRLEDDLQHHTIHPYITSIDEVQECVQFFNPQVAVIDAASPIKEDAEKL
ncbi:hypothetical protein, partial [Leifsonia shinshuensis]|uniref:hypothetical protein n=1 Tax=Leifsonia shinshuensis TaxID=150026 RepID=UPI0035E73086